MKRIKLLLSTLGSILLLNNVMGQMTYWTTPPYKLDMNTATPNASSLPGTPGAYAVANGAYDQNGNLLFYVKDYGIYGSTGNPVGVLAPYNSQVCAEEYYILNSEVAIVPIPGTCKQFYVIYSMDNPVGNSPILYVKVNCSGSTPVVIYGSNVFVSCTNFTGYKNQGFFVSGHGGADHTSLAVSKVYTGSGTSAKRFLFSVSFNSIVKSEITSTGISAGTTVVTDATLGLSYTDFVSYEAELSWGSNYFAWSSMNGKVHVIGLYSTNGGYIGTLQNYNGLTGAKGIEFNNALTNPKLYVSCTAGIKEIITTTQVVNNVTTTGFNLSNTYLEYGNNNKIYGISPTYTNGTLTGTTLVGINPFNNTISSFNPGLIDSRFSFGFLGQNPFFTLPDQIDGEDYNYLNGLPLVTIANFTLNGSVPVGNCDEGGIGNICQNGAIIFAVTYIGGSPTQYKFDIQAADNGCQLTIGANKINYHSNWTTGTPPFNLDLRTLTDGNGVNLGNCLGGLIQITYSIQDACGNVSTSTRIFNLYIPVPPTIALQIYNKNSPQNYLAPSQNIASPIQMGTASLGYRINNSTGTITLLTVLVEEVTNTGALIKQVYNRTTNVSGASGLTYENLNNYCVNATVWNPVIPGFGNCNAGYSGYTGYFSYTNGQLSYQKYYKLTVTVGNSCGSSTNWSYLYVNSIGNRMANPNTEVENLESTISVYPNPAIDNLTVEINALSDDYYEMEITDIPGKQALVLMPLQNINKGIYKRTFDISKLQKGIYSYHIISGKMKKSGVIFKN